MRRSYPRPSSTSFTSAPTASHTAAMAFVNDSFVARKALDAYFTVSAEAGSVINTGAGTPANNFATRDATARSSAPITTRSGCRKSSTAEPSRKNSGFEATPMSERPRMRSTSRVLPVGTVDLFTTTAPGRRLGPISAVAASM